MKMKKIAAIVFSAAMVLNMGAAAMAEDTSSVNISKSYTAVNNGTTKPEETFKFTVSDGVVTEADEGVTAPEISDFSIAFTGEDATATSKSSTLQLPSFERVGIYTYTISETQGYKAGVSYSAAPITMKVTVTQGTTGLERTVAFKNASGEKLSDGAVFVNTYSAGNISVSKKVTGNLGDTSKYFDVKVTVTNPEDKDAPATYVVSGGSYSGNPTTITAGVETAFKLKSGDTIMIANVPYDAAYTVVEADYSAEKYEATYSGSDGSSGTGIVSEATETVEITNNKGADVDTGINLDSMPYIMILALVAVCAVVMFARKRFSANR